jgi:hypothetical protein
MAKYTLIVVSLLVFIAGTARAQSVIDQQNLLNLGDRTGKTDGSLIYTRSGSYYGIMGTPYLNEKWSPATISTLDGRKHQNTPVMYNAHYDLIEAVVGKDTLILDSRLIREVELPIVDKDGLRVAKLRNGFAEPKEKIESTDFFEIIYDGSEITLFRKHYKHLKPSNFDPAYNTGSKFDEFILQSTTYVKTSNGNIEKLKANKKGVLGLMADKSKEVESFTNKEKLKFNVDADLILIFSYYEGL